jgi:hypothetical protein
MFISRLLCGLVDCPEFVARIILARNIVKAPLARVGAAIGAVSEPSSPSVSMLPATGFFVLSFDIHGSPCSFDV